MSSGGHDITHVVTEEGKKLGVRSIAPAEHLAFLLLVSVDRGIVPVLSLPFKNSNVDVVDVYILYWVHVLRVYNIYIDASPSSAYPSSILMP